MNYAIIKNCNYDSDSEILKAIKAINAGWTKDENLIAALDDLEETLREYADETNTTAMEECRDAEQEVVAAYRAASEEQDGRRGSG